MDAVAPEAYNFLGFVGLWRPDFASTGGKRLLYNVYTFVVVSLTELLGLTMILGVLWRSESIDEAIESSYLLLPWLNSSVKCFNVLLQRRQLRTLVQMFLREDYLPSNEGEVKIYTFYAGIARFMSILGAFAAEVASGCIMIVPLVYSNETHVFPLVSWLPYDSSDNEWAYWCFYLHQLFGLLTVAMWNVAVDVLVGELMLQICYQLDVMAHRLRALPQIVNRAVEGNVPAIKILAYERRAIERSVHHHLYILEMATKLKRSFGPSILSQYCMSSVLLCVAIYKVANVASDASQFGSVLLYLIAVIYELFAYCFLGNEVTHRSLQFTDIICEGDWTGLQVSTMKSLLFMMMKTSRPITISCGPLVILSNDTFVRLLKLSYSVFNVLKRSK